MTNILIVFASISSVKLMLFFEQAYMWRLFCDTTVVAFSIEKE